MHDRQKQALKSGLFLLLFSLILLRSLSSLISSFFIGYIISYLSYPYNQRRKRFLALMKKNPKLAIKKRNMYYKKYRIGMMIGAVIVFIGVFMVLMNNSIIGYLLMAMGATTIYIISLGRFSKKYWKSIPH